MQSSMIPEKRRIVVLGAGVIGLTTALKIQETGRYQVDIVADVLPTDPKCIKYTSKWAGAHFVSVSPRGTLLADIDHKTFLEFWELSKPGGEAEHCFLRIKETDYFSSLDQVPDSEEMPNLQDVPTNELIHGAKYGRSFDTVTIDVEQYLSYLFARFLARGGRITRGHVQHIEQVLESGVTPFLDPINVRRNEPVASPDAVIVCLGLGARYLGGVEDKEVYPVRGQTVIVRAPWIKFGRTFEGDEEWTYIIPRHSGDVVIGGTTAVNDWYPVPRSETKADLLKRGLELCPELLPHRKGGDVTIDDLRSLVVGEGCGLRPVRDAGPRIEAARPTMTFAGGKVPVIYNYGHGARGYISSVGSADQALAIMEKELESL